MPKPSLLKNGRGTIKRITGGKVVHTFLKGISPKVNVIIRLEFELTHYDIEVQQVSPL